MLKIKHSIFVLLTTAFAVFAACEPEDDPVDVPADPVENQEEPLNLRLAPAKDTVFEAGGVRFNMIYVPAGNFTMGASTNPGSGVYDPDADILEQPAHTVHLDAFLMADVEVSQFLYFAVTRNNPSTVSDLSLPVHDVSFTRAQQFIDTLNKMTGYRFRLPTEAEWEYAARGAGRADSNYLFAGSNNLDSIGWSSRNSGGRVHQSAMLAPNALGIYDLSGNLMEWCTDWYGSYTSGPQTNPQGPEMPSNANLQKRALRGGSYAMSPYYLRNTARHFAFGSKESADIGIRLVISVKN